MKTFTNSNPFFAFLKQKIGKYSAQKFFKNFIINFLLFTLLFFSVRNLFKFTSLFLDIISLIVVTGAITFIVISLKNKSLKAQMKINEQMNLSQEYFNQKLGKSVHALKNHFSVYCGIIDVMIMRGEIDEMTGKKLANKKGEIISSLDMLSHIERKNVELKSEILAALNENGLSMSNVSIDSSINGEFNVNPKSIKKLFYFLFYHSKNAHLKKTDDLSQLKFNISKDKDNHRTIFIRDNVGGLNTEIATPPEGITKGDLYSSHYFYFNLLTYGDDYGIEAIIEKDAASTAFKITFH